MKTVEIIIQIAVAMGKCIGETDIEKIIQDPKNKAQLDEFSRHLTPIIESVKLDTAKSALELAAKECDQLAQRASQQGWPHTFQDALSLKERILTLANDPTILEKMK